MLASARSVEGSASPCSLYASVTMFVSLPTESFVSMRLCILRGWSVSVCVCGRACSGKGINGLGTWESWGGEGGVHDLHYLV